MSNYGGHYDPNDIDATWGNLNTLNDFYDSQVEWNWPSDLPEQQEPLEPSPARPPPPSIPPSIPHYHRQLPPLSHTNPIASLTAALRGERVEDHPNIYHNPYPPSNFTAASAAASSRPGRGTFTRVGPEASNHHTTTDNQPSRAAGQSASSATSDPASPTEASPATMPRQSASSSHKRSHATINVDDSPKAKKPRRSSVIEKVELVLDDDEQEAADKEVLERERQELVKKQREESDKPVRLNDLNCMICLERFTNMSVTHCGHIFCHECLAQALNASERASERNIGTCPACRKPIKRGPTVKNQIFPLALMRKPKPAARKAKRKLSDAAV